MKKIILTVTLNPAIDKTVFVCDFKKGKDFRESSLFASAGGKGVNVSRVLTFLGQANIATGFLGGTNGLYIKRSLSQEKIKYSFLPIQGQTRMSLTIIDPVSKNITRVLERGPLVSKKEIALFKERFRKLLSFARCAVFSGRNIPGRGEDFYAQLVSIAKKKDVFTILDTSGAALSAGLRALPHMIKPNLKEAEYILKRKLVSQKSLPEAVLRLYGLGVKIVALSMGSRGAIVYDGKEMLRASPPSITRKSPVGCGDALIAGFISRYLMKQPLAECLRFGVSCGSANVLSVKPGFIKRADLNKIWRKTNVERISL
jgi:tagatose 6-phosphate kinase